VTKRLLAILLLLPASAGFARTADDDFRAATEAVAAHDYAAAIPKFEAAIVADPDNLRYGNDYRQAVIQAKQYDRCLKFFEKLVADHPNAANAWMNYGFALVDKIPAMGSVSQAILSNNALDKFSRSIQIRSTIVAHYTRGYAYLYWPRVFNRWVLAVADLEEAINKTKTVPKKSYFVKGWVTLGDAYWKLDQFDKAATTWKEGLKQFPGNADLQARLTKKGDDLKKLIEDRYDLNRRVDTDVWALLEGQQPE
jgi:tetratricopeptide (TPR) repeat protein